MATSRKAMQWVPARERPPGPWMTYSPTPFYPVKPCEIVKLAVKNERSKD